MLRRELRLDDDEVAVEEELPLSRGLRGWMGPERGWWRRLVDLLCWRGFIGLVVVDVVEGWGKEGLTS